jgi:hypothetical protein
LVPWPCDAVCDCGADCAGAEGASGAGLDWLVCATQAAVIRQQTVVNKKNRFDAVHLLRFTRVMNVIENSFLPGMLNERFLFEING